MVRIVLEGDTAEKERYDTRHRHAVREEVAHVRGEGHETCLNLRVEGEGGVFEEKRHAQAKDNSKCHG